MKWMKVCARLRKKHTYLPLDGLDLPNVQHCYKTYTRLCVQGEFRYLVQMFRRSGRATETQRETRWFYG